MSLVGYFMHVNLENIQLVFQALWSIPRTGSLRAPNHKVPNLFPNLILKNLFQRKITIDTMI
jgi:hypothetical protein